MRPIGSAEELEHRRRLAIRRVLDGFIPSEVARFLGVNDSSVRRWVIAFRRRGERGLASRPVSGRPPKLTRTQEKIVLRWLTDSATEHGFPTELWTGDRLALLIWEEFHVRFNPHYLAVWLRARKYSPQTPQRVPRQRDPKAIAKWLRKDWPRIKKCAQAARPHRFYRRERANDGASASPYMGANRTPART